MDCERVVLLSMALLLFRCLSLWLWLAAASAARRKINQSPQKIRQDIQQFQDSGQYVDLVNYLEAILKTKGSLIIDDQLPSLYNYYGVALHSIQRVEAAEGAFLSCVQHNPKDTRRGIGHCTPLTIHRCWINLGEARLHQFKLNEGMSAFYEAWKLGDVNSASRLLRAKVGPIFLPCHLSHRCDLYQGWTNSWQSFEEIVAAVKSFTLGCSPDGEKRGLVCESSKLFLIPCRLA
jgi:tetratricopeptide (TPR) repeat protein